MAFFNTVGGSVWKLPNIKKKKKNAQPKSMSHIRFMYFKGQTSQIDYGTGSSKIAATKREGRKISTQKEGSTQ